MLKVVESSTSLIDTVGNPTDNFGVKSYKIVYGRPPSPPPPYTTLVLRIVFEMQN